MRAPRLVQRTAGDGVSAPRHAAFKVVPRRRRSAATKYLITFPHRFASQKRPPTAESESLQGSGHAAEGLRSEPGATVLDTRASPESERELMALDVVCANHAPALVRAALREIRELDAVRDDVLLIARNWSQMPSCTQAVPRGTRFTSKRFSGPGTCSSRSMTRDYRTTPPGCGTRMCCYERTGMAYGS